MATLTLENIFSSARFSDEAFDRPRWSECGCFYTTLRKVTVNQDSSALVDASDLTVTTTSASSSRNTVLNEVMWHDANSGEVKKLVSYAQLIPEGREKPLIIDDYTLSSDRTKVLIFTESKKVWRLKTKGSYWVLDLSNEENGKPKLQQLGKKLNDNSELMFATFSPTNLFKIAFVFQHNIYVEDILKNELTAITTDGSANIINGTFDWVYEEEFHLRHGFRWSNCGSRVVFWRLDQSEVPVVNLVNGTDTIYPALTPIHYPKTGDTNSEVKIGVASLSFAESASTSVSTHWLKLTGHPRDDYVADLHFHPSGQLIVQQFTRLQNQVRVLSFSTDPESTEDFVEIFSDRDDAWLDLQTLKWVNKGTQFIIASDRNGWRQLFLVTPSTATEKGEVKFLTPDKMDVEALKGVDEEKGFVYFTASPNDPIRRYLYRVNLDGKDFVQVTPESFLGTSNYSLSHDGKFAVHTFSSFQTPTAVSIVSLPSHDLSCSLATNNTLLSNFNEIDSPPVQFFKVPIEIEGGEKVELDAYILFPPGFSEDKGPYPVLFHAYGEPAAQIARDQWQGRMGLWHRLITQRGTVVVCIDNRGTPSLKGRAFRKCVYRKIGSLTAKDQQAAAQEVLCTRSWLDPARVGVWGWSGGGSMALNLLFQFSEFYHAAVSVAPVPDFRFYDTIYEERYMGLPQDNVEGYHSGSSINHVSKMREGQRLLVVHGTGDDNCHYATTERLFNELIAQNKQFDMLAYPNRSHSISEGFNTSRHLFESITRFLKSANIVN